MEKKLNYTAISQVPRSDVSRRAVHATSSLCTDRDRDRDSDRDRDRDRDLTRIEPGTLLAMRTNESMDSGRRDYRVYSGIVDEHVRR